MSKSLRHFLDINELPIGELRNMLAAGVAMKAKKKQGGPLTKPLDGKDTGWVVGDFADAIVHVFEEERRRYYDLEQLWADAPRVTFTPEPARTP